MSNANDLALPYPEAALRASPGSRWKSWQVRPTAGGRGNGRDGPEVSLRALDPGAKPYTQGSKSDDQAALQARVASAFRVLDIVLATPEPTP